MISSSRDSSIYKNDDDNTEKLKDVLFVNKAQRGGNVSKVPERARVLTLVELSQSRNESMHAVFARRRRLDQVWRGHNIG